MADKGVCKPPAELWPEGRGTTKTVALPRDVKGQNKTSPPNPYGGTRKQTK
jgi:hypothetical protein